MKITTTNSPSLPKSEALKSTYSSNKEERKKSHTDLERLLTREDIWRGLSAPLQRKQLVSTGYSALDEQLQGGWPLATLIDITCLDHNQIDIYSKKTGKNHRTTYTPPPKQGMHKDGVGIHYLLFASAIKNICQNTRYWALLNPPNQPYAPGLVQNDLPIDKLLIIRPDNKNDFIACFIELCRSTVFPVIMAWMPQKNLNYSELRKLHLASQKNRGLYLLFRSSYSMQQASPAGLRLSTQLKKNTFQVNILKQKNSFIQKKIDIPLPKPYLPYAPHKLLGNNQSIKTRETEKNIKKIHYLNLSN